MALKFDPDRFHRKWNLAEDPESASAEAILMFEEILRGRFDPVANIVALKMGFEPAADGPLGNLALTHQALMKAEVAFYDAERNLKLGSDRQILLVAQSHELLARSWHRRPNPKQAFMLAYSVIRKLEEIAGGRDVLVEILGRPTASVLAEATIELLGIYVASLRRVESHPEQGFRPGLAEELNKIGFDLLSAYLGPELYPRVLYPGSDAVGAQWFYKVIRDAEADDALIDALYALDKRTRPAERRSEVTAHARDAEYAMRRGQREEASSEVSELLGGLERVGMIRHTETIREQGYFRDLRPA